MRVLPMICLGFLLGVIPLVWGCVNPEPPRNGMLFDFEEDAELDRFRWKCHSRFFLSQAYARHGKSSLEMSFFPTEQVGFSTGHVAHNWSPYLSLQFFVYNPSEASSTLYIQISDDHTQGNPARACTRELHVVPGENKMVIPVAGLVDTTSRPLETDRIKGFYIYMKDIRIKRTLYFDFFRLI